MTKHAQVTPINSTQFFGPETRTNERIVLSLHGKYLADPSARSTDMRDDAGLLLEAVMASVDLIAGSLLEGDGEFAENPKITGKVLRGLFYQLEMINNMVSALEVSGD